MTLQIKGLFSQPELLTEEQLKEVARELGMPYSEILVMYQRSMTGMGLGFLTKEKQDSPDVKEALERMAQLTVGMNQALGNAVVAVKANDDEEDKQDPVAEQVIALLNLPEHQRRVAVSQMSRDEKSKLMTKMREIMNETVEREFKSYDPVAEILQMAQLNKVEQQLDRNSIVERLKAIEAKLGVGSFPYDAFTSTDLNVPKTALKEASGKRVRPLFDLFTSTRLNKGSISISTKEAEQVAEEQEEMFELFTSKELNEKQEDTRPKTGNELYDFFTSKRLN